jgi:RNA polymerase sigma factor (sigma-70 family)
MRTGWRELDCYANGIYPVLSREEELQLVQKMKHSPNAEEQQAARHQLITSCIPWAIQLSKPHFDKGLESDDVIQQALIGLIRSVDQFEPELYGTRLVTYCVMAIRRFILREKFHFSTIITLPYNRPKNKDDLLQRALEVTRLNAYETNDQNIDKSLQAKTEEETPYDDWRWLLLKYWDILTERQQQILQMRMDGKTFQDVGKIFNLTRERIRQIQDQAIACIQRAVRDNEYEESRT